MDRVLAENSDADAPLEAQDLHVTIAFAPFDLVLPAVAGLFRATHGFSRATEQSDPAPWPCTDEQSSDSDRIGVTHAVRITQPKHTPDTTILEDHFGIDPDRLSALLPEVGLLSLVSEHHRNSAERHSYTWREGGRVKRQVALRQDGRGSGWDWQTKGPAQDWEDAGRIADAHVANRCDRALMLAYAEGLGCDLRGLLVSGERSRAVTIHQIDEGNLREEPAPIDWGEEYRKLAVARRFGTGEEGLSFAGFLADNRYFACLRAYSGETRAAIDNTRNARHLLEVMHCRGISPDWQDLDCVDQELWNTALRHAYARFPDAPSMPELERLAITQTRPYRYALNDLRLRNLYASAHGHQTEPDPELMMEVVKGAAAHWLGR